MLIVLVGNIGTGKSTYRKEHFLNNERIICPDEWEGLGSIYQKDIRFINELHDGLSKNQTVVVDGNNINKKAREKYIRLAEEYKCELRAIDFGKGDEVTLNRRLKTLEKNTDKSTWLRAHEANSIRYEEPCLEEGFDEVFKIRNYDDPI